jgi:hypothetical protein
MLIKGKGPAEAGLRYTTEDDILEVDFDAEKVSGPPGLQPPSESFLHIWLYKLNPEVRSVVHVHPETAVLLTVCEKPILPVYGAYGPGVTSAVEGVPVYPRSIRISDHRLGEDFARFMGPKRNVVDPERTHVHDVQGLAAGRPEAHSSGGHRGVQQAQRGTPDPGIGRRQDRNARQLPILPQARR